jgi:hypothetical protein
MENYKKTCLQVTTSDNHYNDQNDNLDVTKNSL